jgi:hypothetical protein
MSTMTISHPITAWTPSVRQLGAVEARLMLRHPAYPIAMIYIAVFGLTVVFADGIGPVANYLYIVLILSLILIYAPVTIIVANRVAGATYRRRSREALDSTPLEDRQRTVAVIWGLVRGPVAVSAVATVLLWIVGEFGTAVNVDPTNTVIQRHPLEYLQIPILVLGAGLLGIAVARWLPWPGMMPLTVLVVWIGTIAMYRYAGPDLVVPAMTWFALWPVWIAAPAGMLPRQALSSEVWHLAYLLGLGLLAGAAALLRTDGPRRGLWLAAGAAAGLVAVASWLQLG